MNNATDEHEPVGLDETPDALLTWATGLYRESEAEHHNPRNARR